MMHVIKKLCAIIATLLLIAGLATGVSGSSQLPQNFPVNIIPIPKDAIIDNDNFDPYDMLFACAKYTTGSDMINFYHDNLKKTIFDLNEAPSKDGQQYWFWGEFDNGNACFYVVILNADNTNPDDAVSVQIRVLLKRQGELYWKMKKDFNKKYVIGALN